MAFSVNKNSRIRKKPAISDINITPFVDVLLVLLIIFMVAAPMMTGSINVDLPDGASKAISQDNKPITVSVKKNGIIYLQNNVVKLDNLSKIILKITNNNLNNKIFLKADKEISYGRVMEIVKIINLAGFSKVVLVTQLVN